MENTIKPGFWARLKAVLVQARQTFRDGGFKAVIRRYGWKFFAVFFAYYLVRDVTLYILLPWIVATWLIK